MIRKIVMLIVLNVAFKAYAQLSPVYNAQSPEVANLGLYGSIPISHYTGTPDISVPLHEIKIGSYTLPISLSYHLAAVKPDSQYGCLGMGWNLIVGGYITRSVNYLLDEKIGDENIGFGFYSHYDKMQDVDATSFNQLITNSLGTYAYDVCADEFTFNFCGYYGHFYLNEDGGWTVISDQDIQLEFNPNTDGFITRNQLNSRINLQRWGNRSENNRFFNKFTLVTPDGCRYEFGGLYATEYSISYYNPNNSDLTPTTWKLSKITTPEGRVIEFNYHSNFIEGKPLLCDIRYTPQKTNDCGIFHIMEKWNGLTGFIIFPAVLESIVTTNEIVSFDSGKDYQYNTMFDRPQVFYTNVQGSRFDPYHFGDYDPDNQYGVFFDVPYGSTVEQIRQSIRSQLAYYYLRKITVTNKIFSDTLSIDFSYKEGRKRKLLEEINVRRNREYTQHQSYKYHFNYNQQSMPDCFVFPETDSWGYYKGTQLQINTNPTYTLVPSNNYYTQADVLTEIVYPTGGKTTFSYDLNSYTKKVNTDRTQIENSTGIAGGLRVEEIRTIDSDGSIINKKRYKYTRQKEGSVSSGILGESPVFQMLYNLIIPGQQNGYVEIISKGGFWPTSYNYNSPIVGYSTVFEETLDSMNNSMGYIRYDYSNYDSDIYGNSHTDENYIHFTASGSGGLSRFTSCSMERGKLLSESYYDNAGHLVKKINHRYNKTSNGYQLIASQHVITTSWGGGDFIPIGWLNKLYDYSYLKASAVDTLYAQTGTSCYHSAKSYTYNSSKMPKTITESLSAGASKVTTFNYANEVSDYNWMADRHILSPIVSSSITERGQTFTKKYSYSQTPSGIPYLNDVSTSYNNSTYKSEYHVNATDNFGNPIEKEKDGMPSVLYWGFAGQALMAKIDNYTVSEALAIGLDNPVSFSVDTYSWVGDIAKKYYQLPPSAHMNLYDHRGPGYLDSYMAPTGFATFYKYDGLRRLREEYYYDHPYNDFPQKKTLHIYDYKYQNE